MFSEPYVLILGGACGRIIPGAGLDSGGLGTTTGLVGARGTGADDEVDASGPEIG